MSKKLIFVILVFAVSVFIYGTRLEKEAKPQIQLMGDSFFEGLKIVNRKNGATDWILWAKRADMDSAGKRALLSGIEMKLQSQDMTILADQGVYDIETRQVSVEGVLHASSNNFALTTDKVRIDGSGGYFDTDGDVQIKGRKFKLEGKGMQADNKDHKVRILKDVKATFNR